ncbi:MAG: thiamine pyrophosphate-binding protein [Acidimicrobiales bacterium]
MPDPATTQATFCATLVDEWVRAGVAHAVIAPGSRSTPMAFALAARPELSLHVHHDERCAAFTALGIGLATGVPAVLLCTSGTAATHFHGAVVEAHQAGVALLVVTADRPPELRDVGAPQAIDQTHLYGRAVRWFHDPGVADDAARSAWRSLGARAVVESRGLATGPGPVHLNLPFREPLLGDAGVLPDGRAGGRPWTSPLLDGWFTTAPGEAPDDLDGDLDGDDGPDFDDLDDDLDGDAGPDFDDLDGGAGPDLDDRGGDRDAGLATVRGIVIAGPGTPASLDSYDWPLLRSARSGLGGGAAVIAHADALLRVPEVAAALHPDVVVRIGEPPASRVVAEWAAASGAEERVLASRWLDPTRTAAEVGRLPMAPGWGPAPPGWVELWRRLDDAAGAAIAAVLAEHPEPTEPGTARTLLATMPPGAHLVVASSMPVRDLEWYAAPRADVTVHANRGANGIDGVLSTAVGVALATGAPTACLIGDVALLHDSNALLGLARRGVDLTVVVVDNDGGGIFSFLPQAATVAPEVFELLYGTPHGVRVEDLAAAHGLASVTVESADALAPAIRSSMLAGSARLVVVRTDRQANVALHDELHAAVAAAARPLV